ncbi:uncharacterized protein LOC101740144 isoform X1 [Bombyx mori]|uniref:Insulin-like domain-containing protein n=1 Tax=Bombyx mori TaxID=7091 RepID=A0A8R2M221_BOMMO|nr:uncharacterized protein LOC101740144 isoform X1 [Bombyx mori]
MLVSNAIQLTVFMVAVLWKNEAEAATKASVKFCGRHLSEIMSRVCHAYNGPAWDVPTVEQPGGLLRRKRQLGIADECCLMGCTWEQLSEYCSIIAYSESPLEDLESHVIADRSAEQENLAAGAKTTTTTTTPAVVGSDEHVHVRGETGLASSHGYGRARGRRCWCRRKRRSGRRRASLVGNMAIIKNAVRAAPVVGTVSPLITWGRTLNTDLPRPDNDRYAYVVYT